MHRRLGNGKNNNNSNNNSTQSSTSIINNNAKLQVDLAHLEEYDAALLGFLMNQPAQMLGPMEQAASDALQSLLYDTSKGAANATNGEDDEDAEAGRSL